MRLLTKKALGTVQFCLSVIYLFLGSVFCCAAVWLGSYFYVLFYPAASFLIIAGAYLTTQPKLLLKNKKGDIHLLSYLLHWPYLLFAWSTWKLHCVIRDDYETKFDLIIPGVYLGRIPRSANNIPKGTTLLVDMTAEFRCASYRSKKTERRVSYVNLPTLDACAPNAKEFYALVEDVTRRLRKGRHLQPTLAHRESSGAGAQPRTSPQAEEFVVSIGSGNGESGGQNKRDGTSPTEPGRTNNGISEPNSPVGSQTLSEDVRGSIMLEETADLNESFTDEVVFIFCAYGHGRSATFLAGLLLNLGLAATVKEAEKMIKSHRPSVKLYDCQKALLTSLYINKDAEFLREGSLVSAESQ